MLQFEEIIERNLDIRSIGDVEMPIPKDYILVYNDTELLKEFIPDLKEKLDKHNFEIKDGHISFRVYFDDIQEVYKIFMNIYYFYLESEGDSNVPSKEEVSKLYKPAFEDFYNQNMPY